MSIKSSCEVIFYGNPAAVIDAAFEKGMAQALAGIISQAKVICPVDNGRLRNSLMWKTHYQESPGVQGEKIDVIPEPMTGFGGVHVYYAVYQEFGTRHMGAQPFLRPAIAMYGYNKSAEDIKIKMVKAMSGKSFGESRVKFY